MLLRSCGKWWIAASGRGPLATSLVNLAYQLQPIDIPCKNITAIGGAIDYALYTS